MAHIMAHIAEHPYARCRRSVGVVVQVHDWRPNHPIHHMISTTPSCRDEIDGRLTRLMMRFQCRIRASNVAFPVAFRIIRVPSGAIPARMARMAARFLSPSVPVVIECNDQAENVTISVMIPVPAAEVCRDWLKCVGIRVGIPGLDGSSRLDHEGAK